MRTYPVAFILFISGLVLIKGSVAQSWNFVKEEDGIRIYTRADRNNSLKCYRGEVTVKAPIQKATSMVGNAKNFDWWGEDFKQIRVLASEENKFVQYYYVYDMPWPFTDRDLAVDARVSRNPGTGEYAVMCRPLLNIIPEKPDLVRINNYWQKWVMSPLPNGNVLIILEGFVDPGGNVPSWLQNMLVTEMPMKTMQLLRQRILSDRPANK